MKTSSIRPATSSTPASVASMFHARVVLGDLNDTPDSANLAPLLTETALQDISMHPAFDDGGFPGTGAQGASNKIDYVLLSPALVGLVSASGIMRKGVFSASDRWPTFPTVTTKAEQASDHAAIFTDINLP